MRPISTLGSPRFCQLPHRSDPISKDLHVRPISTLGSLRFCPLSRCSGPRIVEILPTLAMLGSVGQCPCSRGRLSGNAHARVDFGLCHRGQCPCSHGAREGSLPRECPCSRGGRGVGPGAPGTPVAQSNAHARVSSDLPTCRRFGGEPYSPHRRSNRPHTSQAKV